MQSQFGMWDCRDVSTAIGGTDIEWYKYKCIIRNELGSPDRIYWMTSSKTKPGRTLTPMPWVIPPGKKLLYYDITMTTEGCPNAYWIRFMCCSFGTLGTANHIDWLTQGSKLWCSCCPKHGLRTVAIAHNWPISIVFAPNRLLVASGIWLSNDAWKIQFSHRGVT